MPIEHVEAHPALKIPYPYRIIFTPRDTLASIRRQRNTIHRNVCLFKGKNKDSRKPFQIIQISFVPNHPFQISKSSSADPDNPLLTYLPRAKSA